MQCSLIYFATLCACLVAGCRRAPSAAPPPPAPCPAPATDTAGWQLVDRGVFAFKLPPRFQRQPGHGIDSWVELYATADGRERVSFDYGAFSNDLHLDGEAYAHYAACVETIGGRPATVVTLRVRNPRSPEQDGRYAAAAAWRGPVSPTAHLTIWAEARDAGAMADLLAVVRTVEFPGRAPAPGPER